MRPDITTSLECFQSYLCDQYPCLRNVSNTIHLSPTIWKLFWDVWKKNCTYVPGTTNTTPEDNHSELTNLLVQCCTNYYVEYPFLDQMATSILMDQHHRQTSDSFIDTMKQLQQHRNVHGTVSPILDLSFMEFIDSHHSEIHQLYHDERQRYTGFTPTLFGWKTLYSTYFLKSNGKVVERLDYLWLRIALFLWREDWTQVRNTFHYLRQGYGIHATPTLFYAGTQRSQMASCFLVGTEDSVTSIFKTLGDVAQISKWAGGLGIHISNIRAKHSPIVGTQGYSHGILPMIRLFNDTSRYIDQCFSANVRILIREKGWIPIQEVDIGDFVLTHQGQFHRVSQLRQYVQKGKKWSLEKEKWMTPAHDIAIFSKHDHYHQDEQTYYPFSYLPVEECSDSQEWVTVIPPEESLDSFWTQERLQLFGKCMSLLWTSPSERLVFPMCPSLTFLEQSLARSFSPVWFFPSPQLPRSLWYAPTASIFSLYRLVQNMEQTHHLSIQGLDIWHYRFGKWKHPWSNVFSSPQHSSSIEYRTVSLAHVFRNTKIESIMDEEDEKVMFDLVIEDHSSSYVTEFGLAHNGGGKRKGAFAMYLEPWHADIMEFLEAKRNVGPEEARARDLFYGLWIPDLFMKRVQENGIWSFMCPSQCPHLSETHSEEFEDLYHLYEKQGRYVRQVPARDVWKEILRSQIETGTPYLLYKDSANRKSNQQHLGTIRSSNLCVSGRTRILTRQYGWIPIQDVLDQIVEVWNGKEFSSTRPQLTGTTKTWMSLKFSHGLSLECTPYHKFYVHSSSSNSDSDPSNLNHIICKSAQEIEIGDELESWTLPQFHSSSCSPSLRHTFSTCMEFIRAKHITLSLFTYVTTTDYASAVDILLTLQLMGMFSSIIPLPYDGMFHVRFSTEHWKQLLENRKHSKQPTVSVKVIEKKTLPLSVEEPTFCFSESLRQRGSFEGIVSGNCTEIIEYSDAQQYAVCNLASIALPSCLAPPPHQSQMSEMEWIWISKPSCFYCHLLESYAKEYCLSYEILFMETSSSIEQEKVVRLFDLCPSSYQTFPLIFQRLKASTSNNNHDDMEWSFVGSFQEMWTKYLCPQFDYSRLYSITYQWTKNLNQIIDKNVYPVPETKKSNHQHRPIGLGVQGLADVFCQMRLSFDGPDAIELNRTIFECMYYASLRSSCDLAKQIGPFSSFSQCPLAKGKFHFDLCSDFNPSQHLSGKWNWNELRRDIQQYGVRNSLVLAPMPTATTSQILGNQECFEPFTSNLYLRRTQVGEFYVMNIHLVRDLQRTQLWNKQTKEMLLSQKGSIQSWSFLPQSFRQYYRTVWEISQKTLIDLAHQRHFFIDQSQSLNLFMEQPTFEKLTRMHFYAFSKGLKTGCYYLRSRPPISPIAITSSSSSSLLTEHYSSKCESCSA